MDELAKYDNTERGLRHVSLLCGVDEAGRGPLAGPVCCAAVILKPNEVIEGINDSKKLTESRREQLYDIITRVALAYNVVFIDNEMIDEINILAATMLGMAEAVQGLKIQPELVFIDGNRAPKLDTPCQAIIRGDGCSQSIAAASILAKVSRDRLMLSYDAKYPKYGFAQHKGYPTKLHYQKILEYGITDIHRKSFLKGLMVR